MIARLRVDPIACEGRGLCTEMLPELITLDDWGFPIIGDGPVPRRLLGDVRVTVRACPKLALRISEYPERPVVLRPDLAQVRQRGDQQAAARGYSFLTLDALTGRHFRAGMGPTARPQ